MVHLLKVVAPKQKEIMINQRDEALFRGIWEYCTGRNVVAVVNQWHMEGIEAHWKKAAGTWKQSEGTNPIADMDIDGYQEMDLVNDYLRDYTSEVTNSEPATHQNMLVNYHKENFENERTRHTHHKSHKDVPEPGEKPTHGHH